jgi:biuret amidohydrolase
VIQRDWLWSFTTCGSGSEADRERATDQDKLVQVLAAARKVGIRVFCTRHMSLPKELMGVAQFRMAKAWQRVKSPNEVKPWFLRDAPGFQLIPEMTPLPSEAIFDKISMSAFEGTPFG